MNIFELRKFMAKLYEWEKTGKLPNTWDLKNMDSLSNLEFRDKFISKLGFAAINKKFIEVLNDEVIKNKKCLEIMAGTGALSKALYDLGIDVISTDNLSWDDLESYQSWKSRSFNVEKLDCVKAIEKYGKDVDFIICSWPPYDEPQATQAIIKMREVNPNCKMIYIGEDQGGCTADDDFFNNWKDVYEPEETNGCFERFYGLHDRIYVLN